MLVLDYRADTIRTTLKLMFLGGVDRLVGAVVGFVRGVVIVCVIWGLAATYVEGSKKWIKGSKLALPTLKEDRGGDDVSIYAHDSSKSYLWSWVCRLSAA